MKRGNINTKNVSCALHGSANYNSDIILYIFFPAIQVLLYSSCFHSLGNAITGGALRCIFNASIPLFDMPYIALLTGTVLNFVIFFFLCTLQVVQFKHVALLQFRNSRISINRPSHAGLEVCSDGPKEFATSSQGIRGYICAMVTLKFDFFFK